MIVAHLEILFQSRDAPHACRLKISLATAASRDATMRVLEYFVDFIKERQKRPQDDLISALIGSELRDVDTGEMTKLTFHHLVSADLLVTGRGLFACAAGYLNSNGVYSYADGTNPGAPTHLHLRGIC